MYGGPLCGYGGPRATRGARPSTSTRPIRRWVLPPWWAFTIYIYIYVCVTVCVCVCVVYGIYIYGISNRAANRAVSAATLVGLHPGAPSPWWASVCVRSYTIACSSVWRPTSLFSIFCVVVPRFACLLAAGGPRDGDVGVRPGPVQGGQAGVWVCVCVGVRVCVCGGGGRERCHGDDGRGCDWRALHKTSRFHSH